MPRTVIANGDTHTFPDDTSDDQIQQSLNEYYQGSSFLESVKSVPGRIVPATKSAAVGFQRMLTEPGVQAMEEGGMAEQAAKYPQSPAAQEYLKAKNETAGLKEVQRQADQELAAARPINEGFAGGMLGSAVESLPSTLGGLGIFAATRNPALALGVGLGAGGATQAGATYNEAERATGDARAAGRSAGFAGVSEGALELLPTQILLKAGRQAPIVKEMFNRAWKYLGADAAQEFITQAVQDTEAKYSYNPQLEWGDILVNSLQAAGSSIFTAGAVAPVSTLTAGKQARAQDKLLKSLPDSIRGAFEERAAAQELRQVFGQPVPATPPNPLETLAQGEFAAEQRATQLAQSEAQVEQGLDAQLAALTPEEVLGPQDAEELKNKARQLEEIPAAPTESMAPVLAQLEDAQQRVLDSYIATKPAKVAENPNDSTPMSQQRIAMASVAGMENMPIAAIEQQPGVFAVGNLEKGDSFGRSPTATRGMVDILETWRKVVMPDAMVILGSQSLGPARNGTHVRLGPNAFYIVPKELPAFEKFTTRDPKTGSVRLNVGKNIAGVGRLLQWYNTGIHELGHAFLPYKLFESLTDPNDSAQAHLMAHSLGEDVLAKMEPSAAAVVREYQQLHRRIMDGSLTLRELRDTWLAPGKAVQTTLATDRLFPNGVPPEGEAMPAIHYFRQSAIKALGAQATPEKIDDFVNQHYLRIQEYLSEQLARYAYVKATPEMAGTSKGFWTSLVGYFRQMYVQLKTGGVAVHNEKGYPVLDQHGDPLVVKLKPNVSFEQWMTGFLASRDPNFVSQLEFGKAKTAPLPVVEEVPIEEVRAANLEEQAQREAIAGERSRKWILTQLKAVDPTFGAKHPDFKMLDEWIRNGYWDDVNHYVSEKIGKQVDWDIEPSVPIPPRQVGRHTVLHDQYYTQPAVAQAFQQRLVQFLKGAAPTRIFDLAAGSGELSSALPNVQAFDIAPRAPKVQERDVLSLNIPYESGTLTVMNPPFGKRGYLAVRFFNKAAEFSDTIAGIFPTAFTRDSTQKLLNRNFHLVKSDPLPAGSFYFESDPSRTPQTASAVEQIWQRRETQRALPEVPKSKHIQLAKSGQGTVAIQRIATNGTLPQILPDTRFGEIADSRQWLFFQADQYAQEQLVQQNWEAIGTRVLGRRHYYLTVADVINAVNTQQELDADVSTDERDRLNELGIGYIEHAGLTELDALKSAVRAYAMRLWQEKGAMSPFFQAWFGDWKNSSKTASKVVDAEGLPMFVYHSRYGDYEAFAKSNDIGFHFGTPRAANNRALGQLLSDQAAMAEFEQRGQQLRTAKVDALGNAYFEDPITKRRTPAPDLNATLKSNVVKAFMNLRNPLWLAEETQGMWSSPSGFLLALLQKDIITPEEAKALQAASDARLMELLDMPISSKYDEFLPIREFFKAKGYDGLVYWNKFEGDTSWVAFEPNQVKTVHSMTFSQAQRMDLDLNNDPDFDAAKPDENAMIRALRSVKDTGPVRRVLRIQKDLARFTLTLQQRAWMHPEVVGLGNTNALLMEYTRRAAPLHSLAQDLLRPMGTLPKEWHARLTKALAAHFQRGEWQIGWDTSTAKSAFSGFEPRVAMPTEATQKFLAEFGITDETEQGQRTAALFLQATQLFDTYLQQTGRTIAERARLRFSQPEALRLELSRLNYEMRNLRAQPFLPQAWFGNHVIRVYGQVPDENGDMKRTLLIREAYENEAEYNKRVREMVQKYGTAAVEYETVPDRVAVLMNLPLEFFEDAVREMAISETDAEKLRSLMLPGKKDKLLRRIKDSYFLQGGDKNLNRTIASFAWHQANAIAKFEYNGKLQQSLDEIRSYIKELKANPSPTPEQVAKITDVEELLDFAVKTKDYVMSPSHEMHTLRALVTMSYLAFNPKTALLNMTGLLTTLADSTTRLGMAKGMFEFAKALKDVRGTFFAPQKLIEKGWGHFTEDESKALMQAINEGVIDQSYAYYVASQANAGGTHRMYERLPGGALVNTLGNGARELVRYGMKPFEWTESAARMTTFLLQYRLHRTLGEDYLGAYQNAANQTSLLQADYTTVNRPEFMRGNKAILFIFGTWTQHMVWHAFGGYAKGLQSQIEYTNQLGLNDKMLEQPRWYQSYSAKLWLMFLALAGLEGLPGAENLLDLLDIVWRKLGGKSLRQETREWFKETFNADPGLVMHGLGHGYLLPGYDISRSIGLGRIFPGTDKLFASGDPMKDLGAFVLDWMGPLGGFVKAAWTGMYGVPNEGMGGLEIASRAPGAAGSVATAARWEAEGGVRGPAGGLIYSPTRTETVMRAMGFQPVGPAIEREIRFEQYIVRQYWMTQQRQITEAYFKARMYDDREGLADVQKMLDRYNARVPDPALRLTQKTLLDSYKNRIRAAQKESVAEPAQRKFRSTYRDVEESLRGE